MPFTNTASFFNKRTILLALLLFLGISKSFAQQFYICTSSGTLERVTIKDNGTLVSNAVTGCGDGSYYSIALYGSKLYFTSTSGTLVSADISNGTSPKTSNCTIIASGPFSNSLTADKNGLLYFVSNDLNSIDPATGIVKDLGPMSFDSAGDLVFFEDNLYLASSAGIVKIDTQDPSKSTLVVPITGKFIYGLTAVFVNGATKVYALTSGGLGTDMIELDLINKQVKGVVGSLPYTAYDAASIVENGIIPTIDIQDIKLTPECGALHKGRAEIICKPHLSIFTYTLDNGLSNQTGIFDNLAPGDYKVTITSNGSEQPKSGTFTVIDFNAQDPVVTVTKNNPICDLTGDIKLNASTGDLTSYRVQYNNVLYSFDHVFTGLSAGTYHFNIISPYGCTVAQEDYTLTQETCPPIVISDISIQPECEFYGEATVTVTTAPHPNNYTYTLNNVTNTTGAFTQISPGVYTLVITSSGGDTKQQQITVPDFSLIKPPLTYAVKNAVCTALGQIVFSTSNSQAIGKIKYGNSFYQVNQIIKNLPAGNNHFTIFSPQGCTIDEIDVTIKQDECIPLIFPNAFSPNGDGINDVFGPNEDSKVSSFKLILYNRFGTELFHSQNVHSKWDGTFKGALVPYGVYYWQANFIMPDGVPGIQKGYITLIR